MITAVSHLALSAENPKQAADDYAVILDRRPSVYTTEDGQPFYRFQLANMALEISQATGGKAGLIGLGFEAADIETTARKLGRRGLGMGPVVQQTYKGQGIGDLTRRAASIPIPANGPLRRVWKLAHPGTAEGPRLLSLPHPHLHRHVLAGGATRRCAR